MQKNKKKFTPCEKCKDPKRCIRKNKCMLKPGARKTYPGY